jgi:hypothetical protein
MEGRALAMAEDLGVDCVAQGCDDVTAMVYAVGKPLACALVFGNLTDVVTLPLSAAWLCP